MDVVVDLCCILCECVRCVCVCFMCLRVCFVCAGCVGVCFAVIDFWGTLTHLFFGCLVRICSLRSVFSVCVLCVLVVLACVSLSWTFDND